MTQLESLSRTIATHFEKEPWAGRWRWNSMVVKSAGDWWELHDADIGMDTAAALDIRNWRARPITAPEIFVRILKALLFTPGWDVLIGMGEIEATPTPERYANGGRAFILHYTTETLMEAVALAFCRMNGLEVK